MQPALQTKSNIRACAGATGAVCMLLGMLVVMPPADARGHSHSGARRAAPATARPIYVHPQPRYVHRARIYVAPISPWLAWPATVYPFTAYGPYGPFFEPPYPYIVVPPGVLLPVPQFPQAPQQPVDPTAPALPDDTLPPTPIKGAPGEAPPQPAPQFAPDGSGALYRPAE